MKFISKEEALEIANTAKEKGLENKLVTSFRMPKQSNIEGTKLPRFSEQEEKAMENYNQQAVEIIMVGSPKEVDPNIFIKAIKEPVVTPKFLEEGD